MKPLLSQALNLVLGSSASPIGTEEELSGLEKLGSPPVFSISPSRKLPELLGRKGYTNIDYFVVLPSSSTPRWLLPLGNNCQTLAGIQIYRPHRWAPRIIKSLTSVFIKMGWGGRLGSRIVVASRGPSPLEALVNAVTGELHPVFAFSLGRQPAVGKLTVQVMRPQGDILGYIKLPLTDAAIARVRNETTILERLWKFSALRPHIPRPLYTGNWNDTYVLFESRLEGNIGPLGFCNLHYNFLRTLWDINRVEIPGQTLVSKIAARWARVAFLLGAKWIGYGSA